MVVALFVAAVAATSALPRIDLSAQRQPAMMIKSNDLDIEAARF
jgi:hypothetical protein